MSSTLPKSVPTKWVGLCLSFILNFNSLRSSMSGFNHCIVWSTCCNFQKHLSQLFKTLSQLFASAQIWIPRSTKNKTRRRRVRLSFQWAPLRFGEMSGGGPVWSYGVRYRPVGSGWMFIYTATHKPPTDAFQVFTVILHSWHIWDIRREAETVTTALQ